MSIVNSTLKSTLESEINNKLDSSNVINNTSTTQTGYVLDARQGKNLQDQINKKAVSSDGSSADTAVRLDNITLNGTTLDSTAGSFAFSGSGDPFTGTDWVGLQVGDNVDKFQITANAGKLSIRQNDSGGTNSTSWTEWKTLSSDDHSHSSLTISLNGTSQGAYNGSAAKSINITASSVGALPLSGGTITNGTLTVTRNNDASTVIRVSNTKGDHSMSMQSSTASNIGLYDDDNMEWILRSSKDYDVYLGNTAAYSYVCDLTGVWRPIVASAATVKTRVCFLIANSATKLGINAEWNDSGFATMYATVASSDIRLKENIRPTKEKALSVINKIQMYEFDRIDENRHQKLGFVADYLEKIDPNFVYGGGYDENGQPCYKCVDDFYLDGYLVKAVQELSEENDNLRNQVNSLTNKLEECIERIEKLENSLSR